MLDILIIFDDVGEHVMHIVFGAPPLRGKTTEEGWLESAEDVESRVSVVDCGVSHPTYEDLGETKGQDAQPPVWCHAADEPACPYEERQ